METEPPDKRPSSLLRAVIGLLLQIVPSILFIVICFWCMQRILVGLDKDRNARFGLPAKHAPATNTPPSYVP